MSLPQRLALERGRIDLDRCLSRRCIEPIEHRESLRFGPLSFEATDTPVNGEYALPDVKGKAVGLEATIDPTKARET